jgi:hypothetical protein
LNLPAGNYDVEYVAYENGGGANWELYHAKGTVPDDANANWRLLGAKPAAPKQYYKPTMLDIDGLGNHFDITVVDGTVDTLPGASVAIARNLLDNPGANPVFNGLAPVINHKDPENGVCCGGLDNGDLTWPGLGDGVDNEDDEVRVLVLRMRQVPFVDATALFGLREMIEHCERRGTTLILSGVHPDPRATLDRSGLSKLIGAENVCDDFNAAWARAQALLDEHAILRS